MGSSMSVTPGISSPVPTAVSPNPPAKAAVPDSPVQDPKYKNCWSCRVLSGCTLLGAGTYVYLLARRPMKQKISPGPGTILQMVVGISIACWGVVVLVDPKSKSYPV